MPLFDLIGIIVEDMAASLAFYRRLGMVIPAEADGEGHVEVELPGGLRLAWDTVEVIRSFDPDWVKPSGGPAIGWRSNAIPPKTLMPCTARSWPQGWNRTRNPGTRSGANAMPWSRIQTATTSTCSPEYAIERA